MYFLKYSSLTFSLERARGITVHSPPRESDVGEVTVSCSYSAVFFSACSSVGFPPTQPVSTVAVRAIGENPEDIGGYNIEKPLEDFLCIF